MADYSLARRRRVRLGHVAEWAAAACLMLRGYRILARRWKTPGGEIDLIALRGRRLAFVEVKHRALLVEAEASITVRQRRRIRHGAGLWLARHAAYCNHEIGFDLVFVLPRQWPIYIKNGL